MNGIALKRASLAGVLTIMILVPAMAGAEPAATTGTSQMSVGFTPPEKKADGPRPWTRRDLEAVRRHRQNESKALPRCEQDRLLTDTRPCKRNPQ
jgi:hypothetical protein